MAKIHDMTYADTQTDKRGAPEWLNSNELRAYPVSSSATGLADSGDPLPTAIITDLSIVAPLDYLAYYLEVTNASNIPEAYNDVGGIRLSSVVVTPDLVSVAITNATGGLLVCSYSTDEIVPYRPYPLTPVMAGASGWITFGSYKATTRESYVFSTLEQSRIACRCIRTRVKAGVRYIKTAKSREKASGIVHMSVGPGLTIRGDKATNTITIGMEDALAESLTEYKRMVYGSPGIRTINGVTPNAEGALTLRFK